MCANVKTWEEGKMAISIHPAIDGGVKAVAADFAGWDAHVQLRARRGRGRGFGAVRT